MLRDAVIADLDALDEFGQPGEPHGTVLLQRLNTSMVHLSADPDSTTSLGRGHLLRQTIRRASL